MEKYFFLYHRVFFVHFPDKQIKTMRKEIEKRLVNFAIAIVDIAKTLDGTYASTCLTSQIIRSGTSVALNYGEAQGAE